MKEKKQKSQKVSNKPKKLRGELIETKNGRLYTEAEDLAEVFNNFFTTQSIHTIPHLAKFAKMNWNYVVGMKRFGQDFADVINQAEAHCEAWAVGVGFVEDKSFAKWYLQQYHPQSILTHGEDDNNDNTISIRVIN